MRGFLLLVVPFVAFGGASVSADGRAVHFVIRPDEKLSGRGPISRRFIGFNLPAGHTPEQTRAYGLSQPGTNGVFEALRDLAPGLVRVWTSSLECGLDAMQLPARPKGRDWGDWIESNLADDSPHWRRFDEYLQRVASLGADTKILLCIPTFPPWLGPFRTPGRDCEPAELRDLRSGELVPYDRFLDWCGVRNRYIVDAARFARFARRVELFTRRLISHCLSRPLVRDHLGYVSVGNEPDNPDDQRGGARAVCWRMWVYGPNARRKMKSGRPLTLEDQGLLQQVYLRVHAGLRAADPSRRILIGAPESAWAHAQAFTQSAFYYLGYFIDGSRAFTPDAPAVVAGVGRENLDFLCYHSYSFRKEEKFQHDRIVQRLTEAFGKPVFLTEYNASAAGHGCNFMQSGAAAVADVVIRLGRSPAARGATFFKGSGGGFGLVLNRGNGELWHTGAYWTMAICSRWIVGGQPVRMTPAGTWELDGLSVRFPDGGVRALFVNRSDEKKKFAVSVAGGAVAAEARWVELPLATRRDDYRDVRADEIRRARLTAAQLEDLTLAPRGVLFLRSSTP